jgi:hypothetical protein
VQSDNRSRLCDARAEYLPGCEMFRIREPVDRELAADPMMGAWYPACE